MTYIEASKDIKALRDERFKGFPLFHILKSDQGVEYPFKMIGMEVPTPKNGFMRLFIFIEGNDVLALDYANNHKALFWNYSGVVDLFELVERIKRGSK